MARGNIATERGFYVDTTELKDFTRKLRIERPEVNRKMRRELRVAGKLIQEDAKSKLADYPSVVPTVKVHTSFASVYISTGSKAVPLGGLLEAGNKGRRVKYVEADLGVAHGSFRHPTFGHDPYVEQPMHPHVAPAAIKILPVAQKMILDALKLALVESGFTDI